MWFYGNFQLRLKFQKKDSAYKNLFVMAINAHAKVKKKFGKQNIT